MMAQKDNKFWGFLGKLALAVGLLWTGFQMYDYATEDNGFDFEVTGSHSKFRMPNSFAEFMYDYKVLISMDSSYRENVNKKSLPIKRLKKYFKGNDDYFLNYSLNSVKRSLDSFSTKTFNTSWVFQIENNGEKPLEELILDTPFTGEYKITDNEGNSIYGRFDKNIELNSLSPGYKYGIRIWTNQSNYPYYEEINEKKTRITHKYGFKQVEYPLKVTGFSKWISKLEAFEITLFFLVFTLVIFILGIYSFPILKKLEEQQKTEEIEKFKAMKDTLDSVIENQDLKKEQTKTK